MQLPYFFEESIKPNTHHFNLSYETAKHCVQVLRMQVGAQLNITNGAGYIATAEIVNVSKKDVQVQILKEEVTEQTILELCIAISLLKNPARLEWFIEKAVEIGVTSIVPLVCSRTEKLFSKAERFKKVAVAAMLQSRQSWLPNIPEPILFKDAITNKHYPTKLIAHCKEEEKQNLILTQVKNSCQIFIGPEGDFTDDEINVALQNGYKPVSLGNTRLRTETAGMVAAAILKNSISV